MFKLFKPKHVHNWELVACNDEYSTQYTDTGKTVKWNQRFYRCECGSRKHTDNRPEYISHKGIDEARQNWIEAGVVPSSSYNPKDPNSGYIKVDNVTDDKKDPLEQLNQTVEELCAMMSVIKRDYNLEKKYPKLKSIADQYNRELSKYKTFESLKENNNGS